MACIIKRVVNDEISLVLSRVETEDGATVQSNDWPPNVVLSEGPLPGIKDAITFIKNQATFNSYSTLPPYVFFMEFSKPH